METNHGAANTDEGEKKGNTSWRFCWSKPDHTAGADTVTVRGCLQSIPKRPYHNLRTRCVEGFSWTGRVMGNTRACRSNVIVRSGSNGSRWTDD